MKIDWNALKEAVKEPLRWLVLAIIPFLITSLTELNDSWAVIAVVILRIIDGYLHQLEPEGVAGGLTRF